MPSCVCHHLIVSQLTDCRLTKKARAVLPAPLFVFVKFGLLFDPATDQTDYQVAEGDVERHGRQGYIVDNPAAFDHAS